MGIFEALKVAANIAKESGKLELQGELLSIYEKLLEQQKKISDLEQDNKNLINKLETKGVLFFENNAYWINENDKKDGPYCSCCWDDNKKTIRMQPCGSQAYYSCPKCENKNVEIYPEKKIRYTVIEPESYI